MLEHRESTARQYALADRAVVLGWPAAAVEVIDEDQGHSGSSAEGRSGFQHLLGEVSSDRVGIILGLEMSHLQQGMWNKAERGEVLNHAPIEYVHSASTRNGAGDYVIDPDEQVQAVVRLVFDQFTIRGSISGLLRWLVQNDVKLPVRPHFGSNRGELEWRRPNRVTLLNMLHHSIYAGANRWGHRETDPRKTVPGRPGAGRTFNAHDDCRGLIRDRFAADITWDQFEQNQEQLRENSTLGKMLAAPRHGPEGSPSTRFPTLSSCF